MSAFNWLDDCCVWVRFYANGVVLPLFKYMQKTAIFAFENVATEINICCGGCCGTHMRHIKNVRLPFQLVRCCNSHPCFFFLCMNSAILILIIPSLYLDNLRIILINFSTILFTHIHIQIIRVFLKCSFLDLSSPSSRGNEEWRAVPQTNQQQKNNTQTANSWKSSSEWQSKTVDSHYTTNLISIEF